MSQPDMFFLVGMGGWGYPSVSSSTHPLTILASFRLYKHPLTVVASFDYTSTL